MNLANLVLRHADSRPDGCALVFGARRISFAEYRDLAGRLAAVLTERGVGRGDRVLYYSRNNAEYLIAYTACAWIGAVFAPVHHGFKATELAYVSSNAQASIAFVEHTLVQEYSAFAAGMPDLPTEVIVVGGEDTTSGYLHLDEWLAGEHRPPAVLDVTPETPVLICYTSGSTSTPKPVLRSHGGETWNAETYHEFWDLRPTDRALMALPLSWVYGLSTLGQALLAAGTEIHLLTHFNPVRVVEAITREGITLFGGTNTMYVKMLDVHDRLGGDFGSLRNCYIGGEPSNEAVVDRFEGLIGSRVWQGYAATEAAPVILTDPRRDGDAPRGTVGRLVPGAEIKLVDGDANPVPPGGTGEAYFRCPGSMLEYFREPKLTSERVTDDGWFRTGDLVVERDGYYFVVGRKIDMKIRGGSNIAPAEVESALVAVDGVVDAAVVGIPDAEYGEAVVAVIVTTEEGAPTDAEIRDALSQRLASFKIPTVFVRGARLPDGKTGKRDRRAVRELVRDHLDPAAALTS